MRLFSLIAVLCLTFAPAAFAEEEIPVEFESEAYSCKTSDQMQEFIDRVFAGENSEQIRTEINSGPDGEVCSWKKLIHTIDVVIKEYTIDDVEMILVQVTKLGTYDLETGTSEMLPLDAPTETYYLLFIKSIYEMGTDPEYLLRMLNEASNSGLITERPAVDPTIEWDWPDGWDGNPFNDE